MSYILFTLRQLSTASDYGPAIILSCVVFWVCQQVTIFLFRLITGGTSFLFIPRFGRFNPSKTPAPPTRQTDIKSILDGK